MEVDGVTRPDEELEMESLSGSFAGSIYHPVITGAYADL